MNSSREPNDVLAQDIPLGNDGDLPGFAQPVSQSEIDELLYGEDQPAAERLERLRAIRAELAGLRSAEVFGNDPRSTMAEIDETIGRISDGYDEALDLGGSDQDALAHRETLSPDDDALLDLEAEEAADAVLDDTEWIDGDGFDPDKGVK